MKDIEQNEVDIEDSELDEIEENLTEQYNVASSNVNKEEDIKSDLKKNKEDEKETTVLKEILSWVKIFVGAFIFAYLLTTFVIVNARIPSSSMVNTLNIGDKVIGFRLAYVFSEPDRGDIVMFEAPDKKDTIYIKRIIGIPGDTVKIENNKIYINGILKEESYVDEWTNSYGTMEITLGKDEYFMMGDNRNNSNDSRAYGAVKGDTIIAKAIFRYSPSIKSLT